jgi:glycosyltransferase involved in cell wall biosynthesis
MSSPDLSIVLPVYNEDGNLLPLLDEIEQVLRSEGVDFEVVAVDDFSTDGGLATLLAARESRPWLVIARHRINQGQSAAFATGFHVARGRLVATMDADGQNDPHDLPRMLALLVDGVDLVCGVRRRRQDSWSKRVSSRIANRFRAALLGDSVSDAGCCFRVIRRSALREVPVFNGMHRFLPSILRFQGFNVVEVDVNHRPRTRGVSKYGVGNRLWRGLRDTLAMRWFKKRCLRGDRWIEVEDQRAK